MGSQSWNSSGDYSYTIPSSVTEIRLTVQGAGGGDGGDGEFDSGGFGGRGAETVAWFSVSGGETINATVGGRGGDGSDAEQSGGDGSGGAGGYPDGGDGGGAGTATDDGGGGGGGGSTTLSIGSTTKVIGGGAGGGGGGGGLEGTSGEDGDDGQTTDSNSGNGGGGGGSGSGSYGGSGGSGGNSFYASDASNVSQSQFGSGNDGYAEVYWPDPPAAPSNTVIDIEDGDTATVTWEENTNGGPPDEYEVEISTDGGSWTRVADVGGSTTSHTETIATATDSVQFQVRAKNSSGTSNWSQTSTETTNASGLQVTNTGGTSIDLGWTDPSANDGTDVLLAETTGSVRGDYSVNQSLGASASTATISNLENGEKYFIRVQPTYTGADGTNAPVTSEVTTTTTLPAPTLDSIDASVQREITLQYTLPDNSSDGDVLIEVSTDGGQTWSEVTAVSDLSQTSYTHSGLLDGEEYQYRLTRRTDHAQTQSGTLSAVTILPAPADLSVGGVTATSGGYSWTANHNNGETRVEYKPTSSSTWQTYSTLSNTTESESVDGLKNGEKYDARVVAETAHTATEDQ